MAMLGVVEVRVDFNAINAAVACAFLLAAFSSVRLDQVMLAGFSFDTNAQARFECLGDCDMALPDMPSR